jgi:hypothetical protein
VRFSFPDRLNIRGWDFQETLFSEHSDRPFSIVQIQSLAGACAEGFSEHGQNPCSDKHGIEKREAKPPALETKHAGTQYPPSSKIKTEILDRSFHPAQFE